jgi:hypothetical protein
MLFGDVHGDLQSVFVAFRRFFRLGEEERSRTAVAFDGDYVDKGSNSVLVTAMLARAKVAFPNNVYLTRGNHETVGGASEEGRSMRSELQAKVCVLSQPRHLASAT